MGWLPVAKHPEWASSQDPRHLAELYDERASTLRPVSHSFNAFYNNMPEEVKQRVLINRRIQRIHDQFSQVVDPFILEHTNSVYLLRHKNALGDSQANEEVSKTESDSKVFDLVVYVDNSLVAAELNARRELIRLKYREQFKILIDVFEIRISRGPYKDKYPFKDQDVIPQTSTQGRELSEEETAHISELVEDISDKRIKESFIKAITAQKRFLDEK